MGDVISYTNAKVVLVGDSGVGKSGLSLALTRNAFVPTESTHGRHVWVLDEQKALFAEGSQETREILLWDLAGQPGYRLIHQLHFDEITVALVVFDAHSDIDPFAGIRYWNHALDQAQQSLRNASATSLKKFLVLARNDRGGPSVSPARILALVTELGFEAYFETSAKEGYGINALREAIISSIDWQVLPKLISTPFFAHVKDFFIAEKQAGRLLETVDVLYRLFLASQNTTSKIENFNDLFETILGRLETLGLIRRLSFGNLVLLQPELLDAYASALLNAVRDEPEGLGIIMEERVRIGDFYMSEDERVIDKEQEKLLLLAMIEDLFRREIVLREGPFLIFPSESTREHPNLSDPNGKTLVFEFEGPILNIYTTLAVRLSQSSLFQKEELWQNAITYTAPLGGTCGLFLRILDEGYGSLTLFFDKIVAEETRFLFEEFVQAHLQRHVLTGTLKRRRIFVCNNCGWIVTDQTVQLLVARHRKTLNCPICNEDIMLLDREERVASKAKLTVSTSVEKMEQVADAQRTHEVTPLMLQGKIAMEAFDVFFCYNREDRLVVQEIGNLLKQNGILPWIDEWELPPGKPWLSVLMQRIETIPTAAVFIGKSSVSQWQNVELRSLLREFARRSCPVIPVILADAPTIPALPVFLEHITAVDFRRKEIDPLEQLIWGITGERSNI